MTLDNGFIRIEVALYHVFSRVWNNYGMPQSISNWLIFQNSTSSKPILIIFMILEVMAMFLNGLIMR